MSPSPLNCCKAKIASKSSEPTVPGTVNPDTVNPDTVSAGTVKRTCQVPRPDGSAPVPDLCGGAPQAGFNSTADSRQCCACSETSLPTVESANKPVGYLAVSIATPLLERYAQEYLLDCDYRLQSPKTIETRRIFLKNLVWFLRRRGHESCGTTELRQFFVYLAHGHEEEGGRFGNKQLKRVLVFMLLR